MLGPLLSAVWRQIAPSVVQLARTVGPYALKVPPNVYLALARETKKSVNAWYSSLSPERQKMVDETISWVGKDLVCDLVASATGSSAVRPLVAKGVDLVFERLHGDRKNPEAVAYVTGALTQQIEDHNKAGAVKSLNP